MKHIKWGLILTLSVVCFPNSILSQDISSPTSYKGQFFGFWGWNNGWYTKSDITFDGADYNFVLHDVKATDRQTPFGLDPYFNPGKVTVPQTNMRLGYFLTDHIALSLGVDHMKYVMVQDQDVLVDGVINNNQSIYTGTFQGESIQLTGDFLKFEHTDGLNYINVEAAYYFNVLDYFKKPLHNIDINLIGGMGIGFLYPKTNATLFNQERHDDFNIAGYGLSGKIGLDVTFWQHFFLRSELKAGYINMPNIHTTADVSDKASQHFGFLQRNLLFGWKFRLF